MHTLIKFIKIFVYFIVEKNYKSACKVKKKQIIKEVLAAILKMCIYRKLSEADLGKLYISGKYTH
jgi:hypothetical protein